MQPEFRDINAVLCREKLTPGLTFKPGTLDTPVGIFVFFSNVE